MLRLRRRYRSPTYRSLAGGAQSVRACRASAIQRRDSCIPGGANAIGLQIRVSIGTWNARSRFAARPVRVIGSVAAFRSTTMRTSARSWRRARDRGDRINISCPNVASEGETFARSATAQVVSAARATTDKTLIVKLSPNVTEHRRDRARSRSGRCRRARRHQHRAQHGDRRRRWRPWLGNDGRPFGPRDSPDRGARSTKSRARCVFRLSAGAASKPSPTRSSFFLAGASAISIGTANFTDPRVPEAHRRGLNRTCRPQPFFAERHRWKGNGVRKRTPIRRR